MAGIRGRLLGRPIRVQSDASHYKLKRSPTGGPSRPFSEPASLPSRGEPTNFPYE